MSTSETMDAALKRVLDHQTITGQIYRYCRAMDRIDPELGYSIWHEDGTADYGENFKGSGRGFVDWVCEQHRGMENHSHQVTNIILDIDGDTAVSESYVTAALRTVQEGARMQITVRGRYLDRWSCRDGRWAIDARLYVQDFDELTELAPPLFASEGSRDRQDPSYSLFPKP